MARNVGWPGFQVSADMEDNPGKVIRGIFCKFLNALLGLWRSVFFSVFLLCSLKRHLCLNTSAVMRGVVFCLAVYQEFDHLLEEQSPIESYIEWLDTMVDRCVVKVGELG